MVVLRGVSMLKGASVVVVFWALSPLIFGLQGCSSKRAVYIPKEWRASAPPAPTPAVPAVQPATLPSGPAQPILEPPAQIQEKDLSSVPEKSKSLVVSGETPDAALTPQAAGPQYYASMHLVNNAKTELNRGNAEQAIVQLEQAIQVDAYNAEAFYCLAQAWEVKGDVKRALEFARKAEILYQDEPQELKKVYLLETELHKRLGQASESEIYRQKAARLGM
jgi:tetratricopeptide (TPR) repeat protein